ncbi:MAG: hypothetical protein DI601_00140 [Azospirillum brasilense]|nr:MAG: hypothetical protein DI601_00140 [Azospirillum brasilense]
MSRKPRPSASATAPDTRAAVAGVAPPPFIVPARFSGTVRGEVTIAMRGVTLTWRDGQRIEGVDALLRDLIDDSGAVVEWEGSEVPADG